MFLQWPQIEREGDLTLRWAMFEMIFTDVACLQNIIHNLCRKLRKNQTNEIRYQNY